MPAVGRCARSRLFGAVAFAALLGSSCTAPVPVLPQLSLPAVRDGERSVYEVTRNDSVLYRTVITLEFDEETSDPVGAGAPVPTVVVTGLVESLGPDGYFYDSSVVVARRDSLQPVRSWRAVETDISDIELEASYAPGRARVFKRTVDGTVEESVKLPRAVFLIDMLQTIARAVPPVSGTQFSMTVFVPSEFRTMPVKVSVLGTKLVPTRLGEIMCREVVVTTPKRELRYAYEIAEPRRFVAMRDLSSETTMLLVEYDPGRTEPLPPER